jgi:tetratricopeptide (TPR) repeat protein
MSDQPSPPAGPFELAPPDQEAELERLARVLDLADGFALLLARCNPPDERRRLVAALRAKRPALDLCEVQLDRPVALLLDELPSDFAGTLPSAVFVSGLEHSVSAASPDAARRFLANLNASRNAFPSAVPCPLVLWVPEYVLLAIATEAPGFYSVRSGTFSLDPPGPAPVSAAERVLEYQSWADAGLRVEEKRERVASLAQLLAGYEELPPSQRDPRVEAGILNRLGSLAFWLGELEDARRAFDRSLAIRREIGDRAGEGATLNNLSQIYKARGDYDQALRYLEQSLKIQRKIGGRAGEGTTLSNLSQIYTARGDYDRALRYLEQSLTIQREIGDRAREGTTLNNMAHIHLQNEDVEGAVASFAEALQLARQTGYAQGIYNVARDVGNLLCMVGEKDTGLSLLRESVEAGRRMGAPGLEKVEALLAQFEGEDPVG